MRMISLGVIFHESELPERILEKVKEKFTHYLPTYRIFQPTNSSHITMLWEKITINDDLDMNELAVEITDSLPCSEVFVLELGDVPSWYKRHAILIGIIIAIASGVVASLIAIFK